MRAWGHFGASWDYLLVGANGIEPPTPTMSRWCSNQLSYAPVARANYTRYGQVFASFLPPMTVRHPKILIPDPLKNFSLGK